MAEHITQPGRGFFLLLQGPAQGQHGHVSGQAKGRAVTGDLGIELATEAITRHLFQAPGAQALEEGTNGVAVTVANVLPQHFIELFQPLLRVFDICRFHFLQHVGMATNGALAEDNHAAGEDIGAFHGDGNGCTHPATAQVVLRSHLDALAAMNVHGIARYGAAHFCGVVLGNSRRHRRAHALIHRQGGHAG